MKPKAPSADEFFAARGKYADELRSLRALLMEHPFKEEIKWGAPFYSIDGVNVVGVAEFKTHFALWFPRGALLRDEYRLLVNAQEGKTKAQRQWRMKSAADIKPALLRLYLKEAIGLAGAGAKAQMARSTPIIIPEILASALQHDSEAAAGFAALSEGQRREFAEYIAEAKQASTRARRIEKIMPMIRAGIGLNDRYRR